ncbi:unnamed protein product [Caenorhabditis sp. 36 PRJEB53466]|nr:unnamed protein product [Caenorhabditis sp. 36 PRJEB53466]
MRASESLDGARPEGILRSRRVVLVKAVSFSQTVSEFTLPDLTTFGLEGNNVQAVPKTVELKTEEKQEQQKARMLALLEANAMPNQNGPSSSNSVPAAEERTEVKREKKMEEDAMANNKIVAQVRTERKASNAKPKELPLEPVWKPLTVEDLPMDEDEDEFGIVGVYKCGLCMVGFAPVKKKKLMFVTLTERALELHESEKSFRCGRAARHMVDLSISFNVHSDHYDAKMKKCLCLMGPDETICMRPEGGILTIEGWRRAIVKAIHEARRRKMNRTPRPEDIFDAVYDIRVTDFNKYQEKYIENGKEYGFTNLCTVISTLEGKKRFCLWPNTLAIVDLCIEPTAYGLPSAGFPCFRASSMFILDRSTVSFYGFRDCSFYIRVGKGSPYRGFEISFNVDTPEVCREIHNRLKVLAVRDIENRRLEALRRPMFRPRKPSFQSIKFVKEEPGLREALLDSYKEREARRKSSMQQIENGGEPIPYRRKISLRPETFDDDPPPGPEPKPEEAPPPEPPKPKNPPLKLNANKPSGEFLLSLQREKELMEEAAKNGYDGRTHNPDGTPREIKKDFLDTVCPQPDLPEVVYIGNIINSQDYTVMGPAEWGKLEDLPKEEQSDSNDSCQSSARGSTCTRNNPCKSHLTSSTPLQNRAQSFGANQLKGSNRVPPTVNLPDSDRKISAATESPSNKLNLPDDDPRKRAFSLGSRNFFSDFRRLVSKRHRTSSPHHASTSGISVNSSNASPLSGSVNHLASSDNLENRSGSFNSGRSSPASKVKPLWRGSVGKRNSIEDLVPIDFSRIGRKESGPNPRYPFGGAPPGSSAGDHERELREREEQQRIERERAAIIFKQREEMEAQQLADKKKEKERKALEKKEKKEQKKEKEKEKEQAEEEEKDKEFRPKVDSGIADCTPSSSFSGKKDESGASSSAYSDPDGIKYLADLKKKKKKEGERKSSLTGSATSCSSTNTIIPIEDNKVIEHTNEQKTNVQMQQIGKAMAAVDLNRKPSVCAELIRKSSVCAAIAEEREEQSETDSRGEPADKPGSSTAPVTRKQSSSNLSSMNPFARLRFLSFRKYN